MRGVILTVVVLGFGAGCSETPRPIQAAKPLNDPSAADAPVDLPPMPAPSASDPAAASVIAAALAAHTGGKPDLLSQLKSVSLTREGQGTAGGPTPTSLKWQVHAVWPDRIRYRMELPDKQIRILCLSGNGAWMSAAVEKQSMPAEVARQARADAAAEWLWLLFPLADPTTKFAPSAASVVNGKPATGVRVWATHVPDAVLHFDDATKLLVQITFEGREQGDRVLKQVVFLTHRPYGGVTLGDKVVVKMLGRTMFDWTTTALEPNATIDPKLFENP